MVWLLLQPHSLLLCLLTAFQPKILQAMTQTHEMLLSISASAQSLLLFHMAYPLPGSLLPLLKSPLQKTSKTKQHLALLTSHNTAFIFLTELTPTCTASSIRKQLQFYLQCLKNESTHNKIFADSGADTSVL